MRTGRVFWLLAALALAAPAYLRAQARHPAVAADRPQTLCFGAHPLPRCRAFTLTEFGYSRRMNDSHRERTGSYHYYFTAQVGAMVNRGSRSALGGTIFFGGEDDGSRWGLRPRYRRWLTKTMAVDLAPGIVFAGSNDRFEPRYPGFSGEAGLAVQDLLALTAEFEVIPSHTHGTRTEWFAGVRGGSGLGVVGGLGTVVLLAILVSASLSSY